MRILAVSDEEAPRLYRANLADRQHPVDLLIGCGDLSYAYMDYLVTQVRTPHAVFVHGNHDHPILLFTGRTLNEPHGWIDVDNRAIRLRKLDIIIAGLEGCIRYRPHVEYQYTQRQMRVRAQKLVLNLMLNRVRYGRYMDIFIAHSPMHGIHDSLEPAHRGFLVFRSLVERYKPRLFLHGHTHHYALEAWRTRFGGTDIVNVHPYKFIHLTPDRIEIERFAGGRRRD